MAEVTLIPEANKELMLPVASLQSLDAIFANGEIAIRTIDDDNVERIQLATPEDLPAIEVVHVTYNGQDMYVIVDGYHRKEAALKNGYETIKAVARTYADEDAVVNAAFEANSRHGLASSKQTRSAWAVWLHIKHPEMEQNDIARKVGLVQSSVSRAIAAYERKLQREAAEAVTAEGAEGEAAEGEAAEGTEDVNYNKIVKRFLKAMIDFNNDTANIETDADIIKLIDEVARKGKNNEKDVAGRVGGLLVSASKHIATKPAKKVASKKATATTPVQAELPTEAAKPARTTSKRVTRVPAIEPA